MEQIRPELKKELDADLFLQYYYLKEEMQVFCREHGLAASGGKNEIKMRVETFLRTGAQPSQGTKTRTVLVKHAQPINLSLETPIEENFRCTEQHRAFFESIIGKQFHFSVKFQKYLKEHSGQTYADAVEAWHQIDRERKKGKGMEPIDAQFEYNRYIRAFFADNPGMTLKEAIVCWKYKRSQPGSNAYKKEDLAALNMEKPN